jgi:hypothetical protein
VRVRPLSLLRPCRAVDTVAGGLRELAAGIGVVG